jgi:hypothetical protein
MWTGFVIRKLQRLAVFVHSGTVIEPNYNFNNYSALNVTVRVSGKEFSAMLNYKFV